RNGGIHGQRSPASRTKAGSRHCSTAASLSIRLPKRFATSSKQGRSARSRSASDRIRLASGRESVKPSTAASPASEPGSLYKGWVLLLLLLTYMSSYIDRSILGILQEPIKRELGLSDGQLGMLSGLSFAL